MHIDNLLGAKDFAAKAGDAVLAVFDDRQLKGRMQPGGSRRRRRLHVDDIGGANDIADPATGTLLDLDAFDHAIVISTFRSRGWVFLPRDAGKDCSG
jgi:hypothetical protein